MLLCTWTFAHSASGHHRIPGRHLFFYFFAWIWVKPVSECVLLTDHKTDKTNEDLRMVEEKYTTQNITKTHFWVRIHLALIGLNPWWWVPDGSLEAGDTLWRPDPISRQRNLFCSLVQCPQPFWHPGLVSWETIFHRLRWGMVVLRWFKRITFKLTSCCAAQCLTGPAWYWSMARRLGTPSLVDACLLNFNFVAQDLFFLRNWKQEYLFLLNKSHT